MDRPITSLERAIRDIEESSEDESAAILPCKAIVQLLRDYGPIAVQHGLIPNEEYSLALSILEGPHTESQELGIFGWALTIIVQLEKCEVISPTLIAAFKRSESH